MIRALLHRPGDSAPQQVDLQRIDELLRDKHAVLWLDVEDPSADDMELLGREFNFHELALEDAGHPHQRPKVDEYDHFYFLVFYALSLEGAELQPRELDLFIGENYLVAVHEQPVKEVEEALNRWERTRGTLNHGVGSLVHALLDTLVDHYFGVADTVAEQVAGLEEQVLGGTDQRVVRDVFALKKQLLAIRRTLGPERDALNVLMRQDMSLLDRKTQLYLRDVYDHLVRIIDTVDLHGDLLTSSLDVHLSAVSNRLNQIMKTLTSWTIILMSLALIAGIYGMNFHNIPELSWDLGYFYALGAMLVVGGGLYLFLRRKSWL